MKRHIRQILKGVILTAIGTLIGIGLICFRGRRETSLKEGQIANPIESSTSLTMRKLLSVARLSDESAYVDDITHFIKPYETLTVRTTHGSPYDVGKIRPFECEAKSSGNLGIPVSLITDNFFMANGSDRDCIKTIKSVPTKYNFFEKDMKFEHGADNVYFHFTNNAVDESNDVAAIRCKYN